jgi:uroporphyrinogen III methyltransferase / synthase
MKGKVYLVGAGPGDPGLVTVKGMECIRNADVLINDYLAPPALLKFAPKHAEMIYVGKKVGDHTLSQNEINDLIVEKAQNGSTVVRLKGGDPFIFGRGGEEAEALVKAGIPFEIVPGVTSAVAVPAYAGIPVTHRSHTSTLAIVTGHEDPTKKKSKVDWGCLARGFGTIVFLMGVKNLERIAQHLVLHGMPPDTPVALIRWGTTAKQQTITGTLNTIAQRVAAAGLKPPAIIVVGQVVKLRETLNWFENQPLLGKTIVVTRSREQASDLVFSLSGLGAECLECPTIEVVPTDDPKPLENAIDRLSNYDWLIFTSVNGVRFFFERLFARNKDVRALHHIKTAVIGPATASRLLDFGIKCDIIPESYRAESVVKAFADIDVKNKKILFPKAQKARSVLPMELMKMGAVVDEITAYRTQPVRDGADQLLGRLKEGSIDLITFTSSSTVQNFQTLLPAESMPALLNGVVVACIGPVTADTAKKLGFTVGIVAESFTIPGLRQAILQYYSG